MMIRRLALVVALIGLLSFPTTGEAAQRKGRGSVRFQDGAMLSDKIRIRMSQVPLPEPGRRYEGWLISDDRSLWTSVGALVPGTDGVIDAEWTSADGQNLLGRYSQFAITLEPSPDADSGPSANIVYTGQIAQGVLGVVRQLLVRGPDTPLPSQVGVAVGLRSQAQALRRVSRRAQVAALDSARSSVGRLDESVINIVEGINSGFYRDWNGDGTITDEGDSYGILRYAATAQQLLREAAGSTGATEQTRRFATNAVTATNNIVTWSAQARNLALTINATVPLSDAQIINGDISFLADRVLRGADDNGNSTIDLEFGEGGANGVYVSAQDLARITIAPAAATSTAVDRPQRQPEANPALVARRLPITGAATHTTDILLLVAVLLLAAGWLSRGICDDLIQGV